MNLPPLLTFNYGRDTFELVGKMRIRCTNSHMGIGLTPHSATAAGSSR
jgi:hypothetical protein